ncbi:MAG: 30S ribosomal protein S2 [Kiritimatiellia bacterium]|nr:30S ribosomal protein S2 [Kiritimatiellia bacterium]MDP6629595.1 30S ribosomal protein S2 [Kiritimatiellia bacterium]MDP6809302.1 30S ribosomal protein S2 [Kiritimatiellia bacterium]MDP7023040.1 30S ribosomal protein S2 [Kiritimatiellia bacterium]
MATTVSPAGIGIKDLLDAGLHFGHQTKRWNPKMKRYIFDKRNGIHIIDLTQTLTQLDAAMTFVEELATSGKSVLFVGTKKQAQSVVKDAAVDAGQHYVVHRWLGGTLTNNTTIRRSVRRMRELEAIEKEDQFGSLPKKEAASLRRELEKLRRNLSGVAEMSEMPGAMVVIDINREAIAVNEAKRLNIPVVAIVDTNCDPDPVDHVIPGNDDAIRAIKLISEALAMRVRKGAREYERVAAEIARKKEEAAKAEAEARKQREAAIKAARELKAKEDAARAEAESEAKAKAAEKAKAAAKEKPEEKAEEKAEKKAPAKKAKAPAKKPSSAKATEAKKPTAKAKAKPAAKTETKTEEAPAEAKPTIEAEAAAPAETTEENSE